LPKGIEKEAETKRRRFMINWQNHTRKTLVALEDCDLDDTTYSIPCFADLEPLKKSISVVGIIHRPLVQKDQKRKWIPVLGRRRLLAALELGFNVIEADILEDSYSIAVGYEVAFWDNISHRQFEAPTKAVVVCRMVQLFSREEVAARFLPALGIPPYGPRIEALCRIAMLGHDIHSLMALGRLNEKTALLLTYLAPDERRVITDLIKRLSPNMNKSAELIASMLDLARYRGCPVQEVLNAPEIKEFLGVTGSSSCSAMTDTLRSVLRNLRYPDLCLAEARFSEWLMAQGLPRNINVRPTQAFEDTSCIVEIRVESSEKATDLIGKIMGIEGTE